MSERSSNKVTPRLLSVEQTAAYLGLAEQTIRNRAHELPGRRKIGRLLRFDLVEIDRWLNQNDGITDLWIDARRSCGIL